MSQVVYGYQPFPTYSRLTPTEHHDSSMTDVSAMVIVRLGMMVANTLCVDSTSRRPNPVAHKSELKKYETREETTDAWSVSFLTVVIHGILVRLQLVGSLQLSMLIRRM